MGNCLASKPCAVHPTVVPMDVAPGGGGYRVKVRMTASEFTELARRTSREGGGFQGDAAAEDQLLGRAVIQGCMQGRWQAVCVGAAAEADGHEVVDDGDRGLRSTAAAGRRSTTPALPTITED